MGKWSDSDITLHREQTFFLHGPLRTSTSASLSCCGGVHTHAHILPGHWTSAALPSVCSAVPCSPRLKWTILSSELPSYVAWAENESKDFFLYHLNTSILKGNPVYKVIAEWSAVQTKAQGWLCVRRGFDSVRDGGDGWHWMGLSPHTHNDKGAQIRPGWHCAIIVYASQFISSCLVRNQRAPKKGRSWNLTLALPAWGPSSIIHMAVRSPTLPFLSAALKEFWRMLGSMELSEAKPGVSET